MLIKNVNVSLKLSDVNYLIKSIRVKSIWRFTNCFGKSWSVSIAFEVQFSVPWFCIRFGQEKFDWCCSYLPWYLTKIHVWQYIRAISSSSVFSCWTGVYSASAIIQIPIESDGIRGTQRQFSKNICSEDDLRSRIFGTFVVKFLACLPLLRFSNI